MGEKRWKVRGIALVMDGLGRQVRELDRKVDRLQATVEQLARQIEALAGGEVRPEPPPTGHKDILADGEEGTALAGSSTDPHPDLSADIQIRRLTAQLIAAYNRIAALEEQLLARRIHA